ncbi:carbohydrate kinase family protein [Pseudonocardia spinosispora]|uniref:carbohydrate kinase family protein n=1 Tax=Pseudonocardia spinosispora TaxID=103441 RepID=UPI00040BE0BA|nr:carbohydrate kinase [Pseudonocardia spinosispora]
MIVVGGEALVDLVPGPDSHDPSGPLLPRWGGGPYNVAIALGRLGVPVRFLSRVSTDPFGSAMLERAERSGVDISLVQRGDEPSTLAVVGLEPSGSARYGFYTEGTADRLIVDPGPLPSDTRAVALGTLSMVLEPGASVYAKVLRREADAGRVISLDPNIRPDLITDPDAYRERFRSWLPSVSLLKVSDEDAEWLHMAHPKEWLDAGVTAIIITRGSEGLSVVTAAGKIDVPGVPTVVVDTIGAGDTAHAALLARIYAHGALSRDGLAALSEEAWHDVAGFAAKAAAHTVSRAGAEPPTAAELDAAKL